MIDSDSTPYDRLDDPDQWSEDVVADADDDIESAGLGTDQLISETETIEAENAPPERWSSAERYGSTAAEQRRGETLDERLRQEEPPR
jgi:hypothetical protein